jgi:hypothetical protein
MEFLTEAVLVAATVVLFVTEALKHVPAAFTSRYPVWVNIILSFIGALVIKGVPVLNTTITEFVVQWLVIAVIAAIAYGRLLKPAVAQPTS